MTSRSKPPRTRNKLIRSILTTDEKHSPAHRLDSEAEGFVMVLEKPQETADCARASKKINILGVEMRILREQRFDGRFDGMAWVAGGVGVFEVFPGVLRELRCFWARFPEGGHAFEKRSVMGGEVPPILEAHQGK